MKHKLMPALLISASFSAVAIAQDDTQKETADILKIQAETSEIVPTLSVADYEADQTGGVVRSSTQTAEPTEYASLGQAPVLMDSDEPALSFEAEDARINFAEN